MLALAGSEDGSTVDLSPHEEPALRLAATRLTQWREEQMCLDVLEFEWLRQWYVQGKAHRDAHDWWLPKISQLEQLWLALERLTLVRVRAASTATVGWEEELKLLHSALARRQRLRSAWVQRETDPIFGDLDDGYKPLPCLHAAHHHQGTLPNELSATVDELSTRLDVLHVGHHQEAQAAASYARGAFSFRARAQA